MSFTYDPPVNHAFEKAKREHGLRHAARMEAQLRRLLERWVSELEPCMVFTIGPNGYRFEGLGITGMPNGSPRYIVLPAEG